MSLHTILLLAAVVLFVLDAAGRRAPFKAPFGMLGAGAACFAAAFLV